MTCVNPSSNYPCALCHAKAQEILDAARTGREVHAAETYGGWMIAKANATSARERAEHLQTVHGWRVR